ncbi:MAG: serine hydrolase [Flavobacteriales bacterium]|nr:serine hydrolase [Flavobacteriales bacterium]
MKKIITFLLLSILLVVAYLGFSNYPKLDIITGYSSKSVASAIFLAKRAQKSVEHIDNNFSPINLAENEVDNSTKSVSSTLYGFKKNIAVFREGIGAVVINDDYDENAKVLVPNRIYKNNDLPFPYGDGKQIDSVFANVDYEKLKETIDNSFDINADRLEGTNSVLVVYKDKIIAEKYAEGFDDKSLLLGWSMTKSIVSTMYGIMHKKGMIDIEDKVDIKAWQNDDRKKITYSNLLQMNSGLAWEEDYSNISDVTEMLYLDSDMSKKQAEKDLIGKPNESWYYSSGTTNLLSGKLMKDKFNSQQEYLDFWYAELIDKIGMSSMLIETDLAGNFIGSSYAWANTHDWAKYGLLYLHKGNWNGEQIVDSTWVDYSVTPTNTSNGEYGAQIWLNKGGNLPDVPKDAYFFDGYQGQRVFIVPSKDLVVVRLGIDNTNKTDFNIFLKGIIGAIN